MLQEVLGKLNALNANDGGDGLVAKNVIESDASTFNRKKATNPRLTSGERQRLVNETSVFWETYYKIRGKYGKDAKGKTKVSTPAEVAAGTVNKEAKEETKKGKKGILGMLLALAGFLATFGKTIVKTLFKLLLKGLKLLGKLLKPMFKGLLRLAGKILKGAWKVLKKAAKAIFRFVKRLVTRAIKGIGRLLKRAFTGLMKSKPIQAAKKLIQSGIDKVKNFFSKIKNFFINKLKSVGKFFKSIFSKLPGISRLFPALAKGATGGAAGGAAAGAGGRGGGGRAPKPPKPQSLLGRGLSMLGGGLKSVGNFVAAPVKYVAEKTVDAGKYVIKKGKQGIKAVANVGKGMAKGAIGKAVKTLVGSGGKGIIKFLGGTARRIPIIGPLIEGLFAAYDIKQLKKQFAEGEIDEDQLHQQVGRRAINGIGAATGAGAGAILAGLLTSVTGPGAVVAAIVGGVLGDIAGRFLANLFTDYILPEKYTKSIGKFFTGNKPPAPAGGMINPEMQDFIMQGGNVMPFSSKDQVLGMKTGGAIDQLFSSVKGMGSGLMNTIGNIDTSKLTSGLSSAAGGIGSMFKGLGSGLSDLAGGGLKEEVAQSNHYLKQLVHLTAQGNKIAIASGKRGAPVAAGNSPIIDKPSSFSDSRSDYFNSPYSINVPST